MLGELRVGVEARARVVEVDVPAGFETGELRTPQLLERGLDSLRLRLRCSG